jgi:hypothetical protein
MMIQLVLTPNDLLLRNPAVAPHEVSQGDRFGSSWKQAHYLADIFWKRWLKEYLPQLQLRQKWIKEQSNVGVGDLVLLANEKKPRGQWPKAIVEQTFPDEKGKCVMSSLEPQNHATIEMCENYVC